VLGCCFLQLQLLHLPLPSEQQQSPHLQAPPSTPLLQRDPVTATAGDPSLPSAAKHPLHSLSAACRELVGFAANSSPPSRVASLQFHAQAIHPPIDLIQQFHNSSTESQSLQIAIPPSTNQDPRKRKGYVWA
jgi:hypothetical protein